ncbi:MAG: hypothetical protein EBS98_10260 [Chitinophagia bacterium]|nr:hypothetical protein [Chitinophagia bacterium]
MLNFKLKLLDTDKQINTNILQALIPEIDDYLKKNLSKLRQSLPNLIRSILMNTPEYNSLMGGQLQFEFGIPDPSSAISSIINIWSNNIKIEYNGPKISSSRVRASFSVSLIRSDYADVLSSDDALVIDNLRGYNLPWLEWLLLEGNKIIVRKQQVEFGPNIASRTGNAIMRPSNKSWRVPSEFAGTITNNWITRAIDNSESQIYDLLDRIFV